MIWRLSHAKWIAGAAARVEGKQALHDLRKFVESIADDAPADKDVLSDPGLEPMFEEEMGEALSQHGAGVLDDMWAFLDWGFAPEDVAQPVSLFYGDADQILAPQMYRRAGRAAARSARSAHGRAVGITPSSTTGRRCSAATA